MCCSEVSCSPSGWLINLGRVVNQGWLTKGLVLPTSRNSSTATVHYHGNGTYLQATAVPGLGTPGLLVMIQAQASSVLEQH